VWLIELNKDRQACILTNRTTDPMLPVWRSDLCAES
jgi:hypothetical protein